MNVGLQFLCTPTSQVERTKCSTGRDIWVTEFTEKDSYNPLNKHIKNHLLNITPALSKKEAVSAFVPKYLETFQVSESKKTYTKMLLRFTGRRFNFEIMRAPHINMSALWHLGFIIQLFMNI